MKEDWVYFSHHAYSLSDDYRSALYEYSLDFESLAAWLEFTAVYMGISF